MTFEQFQQTREENTDLGVFLHDEFLKAQKGLLYLDALFIEHVNAGWPEAARQRGRYHLLIGRDEWISNDLEELERKLYAFAQSEGYFDSEVTTQTKDDRRNTLIAEYQIWQASHGLVLGSSYDHHHDENLTEEQCDWLRDFSHRWEVNEYGEG